MFTCSMVLLLVSHQAACRESALPLRLQLWLDLDLNLSTKTSRETKLPNEAVTAGRFGVHASAEAC